MMNHQAAYNLDSTSWRRMMRFGLRWLSGLFVLLALFLPFAASAEDVQVRSFGKIRITGSGQNWTADLGKLGTHRFTGTISPLKLKKNLVATDYEKLPGKAVLKRLGLQEAQLTISSEGLGISARVDTKRNLNGMAKLFKIEAPFIDISARIAPAGLSLRGDLNFSRKSIGLVLIPGLGTRLELDSLSLIFDIGTGLPDMDAPLVQKMTTIDLEIAPVISVRAEARLQPSKWDPLLKTVTQFSYNLVTQEMTLAGSIMDRWVNPLGMSLIFKNREVFVFENAAMEIGWIPGSPVPTKIGYGVEHAKVFGLRFGSVVSIAPTEGQIALKYHLDRLSFNDLANVITKGFGKKMPNLIPGVLGLRNVQVLFSPNGGSVGELQIPQGFILRGEANIGQVLSGTIQFSADFEDGIDLTIELKNSLREHILKELKNRKVLKAIVGKLTSTLDIRRIAISFKAKRSELGGGIACDMMIFGRNLSFNYSGSINPEALAKEIVDRIVHFCQHEVKEAFVKVGKAFVKAGDVARQWAVKAGARVRAFAVNLGKRMKHSGHSYNKCMGTCVPDYAGGVRRDILDGSNDAVNEFYRLALENITEVEGDTEEETRKLRQDLLADEWKKLCDSIDSEWNSVRGDNEVRKFFTKAKSKDEGVLKYQLLIDETWGAHKTMRQAAYERLMTVDDSVNVSVTVFRKGTGNVTVDSGVFAGTKGEARPIQDFSIAFKNKNPRLSLRYKAHMSNVGDTQFVAEGKPLGYAGKQNIEGFSIELTGPDAYLYEVYYEAHVANIGDIKTVKNGEYCGTRGRSLAIEGLSVWVVKKTVSLDLAVSVHVRGLGSLKFGSNQFAGTTGRKLPIQDFTLAFRTPVPGLGIRYMAHVSNVGDTPFKADGQGFGYAGRQSIEGFSIQLTGENAAQYDVFYSAHVSNVGDTQTFKNGEYCGFRGRGLAVEGLKVWVQKK